MKPDKTADKTAEKGKLKSLKQLKHYLEPYRIRIVGALVALFFSTSIVLLFGKALQYLIDEGIDKHNIHMLDRAFLAIISLILGLALSTYARYYLMSWIGEKVVADIRREVYGHIIRLNTAFFENTRTGELLSRITTDTTLLQNVVGSSVSIALRNTLLFLGGSAMMFSSSPRLSTYVSVIVPIVVVPLVVFGKQVRQMSRATQNRVADISSQAEETISGIRTIQALALEDYESGRFSHQVDLTLKTALSRIRLRSFLMALVISLVFGAIMIVLWIGAREVMQAKMSSGELSAFLFYAVVVAGSVGAVSDVFGELQRAAGATERLMELLSYESEIKEVENPVALPKPVRGAIHFNDVSFNYPSRPDKTALDHINLNVEPGETIALVGPSGAGKTTLFQLLLRFYDPAGGLITVDGVDIRNAKIAELRSHIALVPQDPVIFSANAWDNIRCGKQTATAKEVIAAAAGANALEFLEKMPDGLDTHLGEKGVKLSGGQKQRIAIARAIVRNPRILLLDEATSALDSENERKVQYAFDHLMKGRTTLVIAHRLSTVQNASRIAVINDGKIEAIGKHDELLVSNELYKRLASLQFKL